VGQVAFGLSAFASNPDLAQISAGSALVNVKLALLFGAVRRAAVREGVPIDIANVTGTTGTDEPYWHNGALLLVPVNVLPSCQRLSMNKKSRASVGLL
jgi:hypothetical protein